MSSFAPDPIEVVGSAARRLVRVVQLLLVASVGLFALVTFTRPDDPLLLNFFYYGSMGFAVLLCAARAYLVGSERLAWSLVALALLCDLAAHVILAIFDLPFPSIADAISLGSYIYIFAFLLVLGRHRLGRIGRVVWLDGLIATLTLSALAMVFVFPAIVSALPDENLASVATLAYPFGDLIVLATLFVILAVSGWQIKRAWWGIVAAALVWAAGDVWYSYLVATDAYSSGLLVELTWPTAAMLIAFSAWSHSHPSVATPGATWRAGSLASVSGLLAIGIVVAGEFVPLSSATFYLAIMALGGLGVRLIVAHRANDELFRLAHTDPLTGINSRGRLTTDARRLEQLRRPVTVAVFDLDGFKLYNDSFGHAAGDALLQRISHRLAETVDGHGTVYRIGGDEFTALLWGDLEQTASLVGRVDVAMAEHGDRFDISASRGLAAFPAEETSIEAAMALADERMYDAKTNTRTSARSQVHEALVRSLREREPDLADHTDGVRELTLAVAQKFFEFPDDIDVVERAAQLHDVGKVAIPDAILYKPGPLNGEEKSLMDQHTLIGERIITASPALAPVGTLVRHSHEHWDGSGYPDGLFGEEIPLGSRIILACDAFDAMLSERPYSKPLCRSEAITELGRCSGTQFDPAVVTALIEVLREVPEVPPPVLVAAT